VGAPANGVTGNDSGDGDNGPNDLLNFPVLNGIVADGTVDIGYDFNLDVPSNGNGYRIDFFKNTTADGSGHGEGEIHLGSLDVAHAGGDLNFTGTMTASASVSVDDIISTTTTRKTGGSTYDITSEFSAQAVCGQPSTMPTRMRGTTRSPSTSPARGRIRSLYQPPCPISQIAGSASMVPPNLALFVAS